MLRCEQAVQLIQQGQVQHLTIFVNGPSKFPEAAQLTLVNGSLSIVSPLASSCNTGLQKAVQQANKKLPADQQIQISQQSAP
jgi:hypothetical protein